MAAEKVERKMTKGMLVVISLNLMLCKLHIFKESISLGLTKKVGKNNATKGMKSFLMCSRKSAIYNVPNGKMWAWFAAHIVT